MKTKFRYHSPLVFTFRNLNTLTPKLAYPENLSFLFRYEAVCLIYNVRYNAMTHCPSRIPLCLCIIFSFYTDLCKTAVMCQKKSVISYLDGRQSMIDKDKRELPPECLSCQDQTQHPLYLGIGQAKANIFFSRPQNSRELRHHRDGHSILQQVTSPREFL